MPARNLNEALKLLRDWKSGQAGFTAALFPVLQQADPASLARLEQIYPEEGRALRMWETVGARDQAEFWDAVYRQGLLEAEQDCLVFQEALPDLWKNLNLQGEPHE